MLLMGKLIMKWQQKVKIMKILSNIHKKKGGGIV